MLADKLVVSFKEIDKNDIGLVGGKGANLGEMLQAGFPVPNGFCVTVNAYDLFLEKTGIRDKIFEIISATDVNNSKNLQDASRKVQNLIISSPIPEEIIREVTVYYKRLSNFLNKALVAVRSSATAEDLPQASFAGQQASFLNVKGETNLLIKIRECWASLFTERAIFYREQNKIPHKKVKISVIVQKMVQSLASGVMFTVDPLTKDKDKIIIEAIWGLGELIVQGAVVPDRYVVQKDTFAILSKEISDQRIQLVKIDGENKEVEVPKVLREKQKLSDKEIIKLAKIGNNLQRHYYFPQDIEWAKEGRKGLFSKSRAELYIIQTRPVTTLDEKQTNPEIKLEVEEEKFIKIAQVPILTGVGASPGIGSGYVKILKSPKEIAKVKANDVLVAPMTSPDFVPAMKKASAIVTDEGGLTSHAAIVSRELGIPCVVGTKLATTKLKEDTLITVDGSNGLVYLGAKIKSEAKVKEVKEEEVHFKTATKLYVNLAEVERARETSKLNVDGVGLLRAEFMIANIGIHPKEAIKRKKQIEFIDKLAKDLTTFCKYFYPRPVVYRATDFKTNEYRSLPGGTNWEPEEANPMLGFRGAFRYITDPEVFNLEIKAIQKVRERFNNLWLMIPFVRSPEELAKVRRIVASEGLFKFPSFKFWMMVEIPVNVILIEDFIKVGIDGVSIGSNDLTMLLSGTDRDNALVAKAFDERSKAVLWSLRRVIRKCNKYSVTSSICGQAPSQYEDLVFKLVSYGITSISVNPDALNKTRKLISEAEKTLVVQRRKKH